jgi:hypothetical protein
MSNLLSFYPPAANGGRESSLSIFVQPAKHKKHTQE